ncbi:hypothetical protein G6N76_23115 [Rhizobium daejeonense]|jgi:hypothetical protein|uniref:Uncharacterized protein n=1 Tax=Rhizobium daejeonense TaxID=240521 RepID=A0A6M1S6I5_9HYPH|nr:hypothetical protein [Rhizobium daejeonense]NGO66563.1 hypothetical protein [Rhizobium daejeonense]
MTALRLLIAFSVSFCWVLPHIAISRDRISSVQVWVTSDEWEAKQFDPNEADLVGPSRDGIGLKVKGAHPKNAAEHVHDTPSAVVAVDVKFLRSTTPRVVDSRRPSETERKYEFLRPPCF